MAELIVVRFHGMGRAGEVLYELQRMADDWTVDLQDAVPASIAPEPSPC
jgi:uncharacterized membrane protein